MQGSFEKKVQEKLDELKLTPSVPVWEKVEQQIRPEKTRRRVFFWLPLGLLLMAGAGWWFWTGDEKRGVALSGKGVELVTASTPERPASPEKTTTPTHSGKGVQERPAIAQQKQPSVKETVSTAGKGETIIGNNSSSQDQTKAPVAAKTTKRSRSANTDLPLYEKEAPVRAAKSGKAAGEANERNTAETDSETILANKAPNTAINKSVTAEEKEPAVTAAVPVINADSLTAEKKPETLLKDSAAIKRKIAVHKKWKVTITAQ
jgi:hypothetical protein